MDRYHPTRPRVFTDSFPFSVLLSTAEVSSAYHLSISPVWAVAGVRRCDGLRCLVTIVHQDYQFNAKQSPTFPCLKLTDLRCKTVPFRNEWIQKKWAINYTLVPCPRETSGHSTHQQIAPVEDGQIFTRIYLASGYLHDQTFIWKPLTISVDWWL